MKKEDYEKHIFGFGAIWINPLMTVQCKKCGKTTFINADDLGKKEERMCFDCKKSNLLLIEYKK